MLHFRGNAQRVERDSAIAFSRLYAREIWSFYSSSNRFPSNIELSNEVFGRWTSHYNFEVVNETERSFHITAKTPSSCDVRMLFRLSDTGAVERHTTVIAD